MTYKENFLDVAGSCIKTLRFGLYSIVSIPRSFEEVVVLAKAEIMSDLYFLFYSFLFVEVGLAVMQN